MAAESPALLLSASIVRLGRSPGSNHKHEYKFDTDSLVSRPHTPRRHRKTTHYGNTTTRRPPNAAQKNTEKGGWASGRAQIKRTLPDADSSSSAHAHYRKSPRRAPLDLVLRLSLSAFLLETAVPRWSASPRLPSRSYNHSLPRNNVARTTFLNTYWQCVCACEGACILIKRPVHGLNARTAGRNRQPSAVSPAFCFR